MKREQLKALGLDDEVIKDIMKLHGETIESKKKDIDQKLEQLQIYEDKIQSYENQLSATKNMLKENDEYKGKYSQLESTFKDTLKAKDTELTNVTKRFMVKDTLSKSGAKHVDLLIKQIDLDKLSVDNDKLLGMDDILNGLKTNYSDLFVETNNTSTNEGKVKADKINQPSSGPDWANVVNNLLGK